MNAQRQTNTFSGGMNKDLDYSLLKDNQYIHAENIRVVANEGSTFGVIQNIEGVAKLDVEINGETILHTNTIRDFGIVFTKTNNDSTYSIYRYDFRRSDMAPKVHKIIDRKPIDIKTYPDGSYNLSSVCQWEADDNVKIYWADGTHMIRVLHIDESHDEFNKDLPAEEMNIIPNGVLPSLKLKNITNGGLLSGKYQYAYVLFNPRGSETSMSTVSQMIPISKGASSSGSMGIIGSMPGEVSGKGIEMEVTLPETSAFSRAKIIRVFYKNNTGLPTISIINDISISAGKLIYTDRDNSFVSELTVDEFNIMTGYSFIPKLLESKDNRLFAANITEDTWDVSLEDFDARSYGATDMGTITLESHGSEDKLIFPPSQVGTINVPIDHDCISRGWLLSTPSGMIYGGQGKNIDYQFITTSLIEDSNSYEPYNGGTMTKETWQLTSNILGGSGGSKKCKIYTFDKNKQLVFDSVMDVPYGNGIHNYSNLSIASSFAGYMRGETYRFGIVFYNEKNTPSTVHWIGDIKFPEIYEGFPTFIANQTINPIEGQGSVNAGLATYPLGIQFKVKNLPKGVTGYEIVRCKRTEADKTIVSQGVVSTTTVYDKTSPRLFPKPYLSYSDRNGYHSRSKGKSRTYEIAVTLSENQSPDYFLFISPEIAVNRENSTEMISRIQEIQPLGRLYSRIKNSLLENPDTSIILNPETKLMANCRVAYDYGDDIGKLTEYEGMSISTYKYNGFTSKSNQLLIFDGGEYRGPFYTPLLAKYYFMDNKGFFGKEYNSVDVESITLAKNTSPFGLEGEGWRNDGTTIGSKTYYNWMYDMNSTPADKHDENNTRREGPHGICAVFQSTRMIDKIQLASTGDSQHTLNSVVLVNAKQKTSAYGGNTFASRQNSVYISTGVYTSVGNDYIFTTNVFGGDTYICIFDYAQGMLGYNEQQLNEGNRKNKSYVGAYIPLETSINLSLRADSIQTSKTYRSDGWSNHFVQNDIISIGKLYSQGEPLYMYNDAYSRDGDAKLFVPKSLYDQDDVTTDVRVMVSELKINNEVTDSWTKFKVANFIDVDSVYGPITGLRKFKSQLLYWQEDAFGTLSVNERSLIQDNNIGLLTLGSGGVLDRYDHLAIKNGLKEGHSDSIAMSESTVYWYDWYRNEICGFDGEIHSLAKIKGMQSWITENKSKFRNRPISAYDSKYNEVLFALDDNVLLFNEQLSVFISFTTIMPSHWLEFSEKYYSFFGSQLYKHNSGEELNLYGDSDKLSVFRFVVNESYPQTKTFDNVEYSGDFTYPTNFKEIGFYTKRQDSFKLGSKDIDYREDTYKFAVPRNSKDLNEIEHLANKSYRDRMKGKYMICEYKFDCKDGKTFAVPYISTAYRHSKI